MAEGVCFHFPETRRHMYKHGPERALVPSPCIPSPCSTSSSLLPTPRALVAAPYSMKWPWGLRPGQEADPGPGCRLFLQQPLTPDTLPTPLAYPPPHTRLPPVASLSLSASGCLVSFTLGSLSLSCSLLKVRWYNEHGMFSQPLWNLCSGCRHQSGKSPQGPTH